MHSRDISWGEDRIKSSEGLSGLRHLTRQLSGEVQSQSHGQGAADADAEWDRLGKVSEEPRDAPSPSPLRMLGISAESVRVGSPDTEYAEGGQDFPEDIQSSKASSVIEHELLEGKFIAVDSR
jgi:hypothetical protein